MEEHDAGPDIDVAADEVLDAEVLLDDLDVVERQPDAGEHRRRLGIVAHLLLADPLAGPLLDGVDPALLGRSRARRMAP
jgi:hypothetical protein